MCKHANNPRLVDCHECGGAGYFQKSFTPYPAIEPDYVKCKTCEGEGCLPLYCDVCGAEIDQSDPAYNFPYIMTRWGDKKQVLVDEIYCYPCAGVDGGKV